MFFFLLAAKYIKVVGSSRFTVCSFTYEFFHAEVNNQTIGINAAAVYNSVPLFAHKFHQINVIRWFSIVEHINCYMGTTALTPEIPFATYSVS